LAFVIYGESHLEGIKCRKSKTESGIHEAQTVKSDSPWKQEIW
jgi:hypothetical protein